MSIKIDTAAFVEHVLDGKPLGSAAPTTGGPPPMMVPGFQSFPTGDQATTAVSDEGRFAQLLLENSGFGAAPKLPLKDFLLGDQRTEPLLPSLVTYWSKTPGRPFHVLLFQLEMGARDLLANRFFRKNDTLEDALHRITQDALDGFARGGAARTAARKQGAQRETLCVVAVADDRRDGPDRQVVCFGTKCQATDALEVFTLREEVRDWDRPLAEEHLEQLFKRHFRKLGDGAKWQEAFVSGPERVKAEALMTACSQPRLLGSQQNDLKTAVYELLDQLAWSFGIPRRKANQGRCLEMEDLPPDHSIAVDPDESRRAGFANRLKGVRIFDSSDRLLGYIVYVVDKKEDLAQLQDQLREHNHFHNVLVVYPGEGGGTLELWQGDEPLRGRLTAGSNRSRFDGVGGVVQLLSRFFVVSRSAIEKPEHLARELAWRARHLKAIALDELKREQSEEEGPLYKLYRDFNQALAQQDPEQFADTYAQTITYGMLAARWLARDKLTRFTRKEAMRLLPSTSEFLRELFNRLINDEYDTNLTWLLDDITSLLSRTLVRDVFHGEKDPSIHFYQDFLDAYDPAIRRRMGVYYTPDEVVEYIVRFLDHLARTRLGLRLGLADPIKWAEYAKERGIDVPDGVDDDEFVVQILDPATGTGTFLLHTLEVIFETMTAEFAAKGFDDERSAKEWKKYVREGLLPRLNAFELMMAPYIVTHLRLGLALEEGLGETRADDAGLDGAEREAMVKRWSYSFASKDRLRVFLTNTLEIHASHQLDWISKHVAVEAREAERLKTTVPVCVVLGNPPYERVAADTDSTSRWLLRGKVPGRTSGKSLFDDIYDVARKHTVFSHHASLYDRYVFFWRWALWKAFEHPESSGLVGFITNATWLAGPGFIGLRELARRLSDEVWVADLGGDSGGARSEPNVFNIETPVAIAVLWRGADASLTIPASSNYQRIQGDTGQEKLNALEASMGTIARSGEWQTPTDEWFEPLVPPTGGAGWIAMPALSDLFPWQQPGCKFGRTWPIAPHRSILQKRWKRFVESEESERPALFYTGSSGRNVYTNVRNLRRLVDEPEDATPQPIQRYGYRSFDRQWAFNDPRMAKTESPSLWFTQSPRQIYLTSLMTGQTSAGPILTVSAYVPDLHHFRGSYGGKDVIPLYRDERGLVPNVTHGLLESLGQRLSISTPTAEDLAAYTYALLSCSRYQETFCEALTTPGARVPMTCSEQLWMEAVRLGSELIWLHTFGERFADHTESKPKPQGLPEVDGLRWKSPVRQMPRKGRDIKYQRKVRELSIGDGCVEGVRPEVWDYSVSGMQVVKKWLGYRTQLPAGRAASSSSDLDHIRLITWPEEWNQELINLLTLLTLTIEKQEQQGALLDRILAGPLIPGVELPQPSKAMRKPPKAKKDAPSNLMF